MVPWCNTGGPAEKMPVFVFVYVRGFEPSSVDAFWRGTIWVFPFRFSGLFSRMWNDLTLFIPLLGLILKDVE
jgi:uncharacterized membrane protein